MFIHFSIVLKIFKMKGKKFDQNIYDFFFHSIENDLRELGYGDVTVNKKMKDLNKILYDILLKIEKNDSNGSFQTNPILLTRYFAFVNDDKLDYLAFLNEYFVNFYNFCFELPLENMLNKLIILKISYGSSKKKNVYFKKKNEEISSQIIYC